MNRSVRSLVCLAAMGAVAASYGQDIQRTRTHSPTDAAAYKVLAYELSVSEETSFSTIDGVASPFWFAWEAPGVNLSSVKIDAVSNFSGGVAAEGVSDGAVLLKVAYGALGIYILYAAQDDAWAGYVSPIDYQNDACELFAAKVPTSVLYGDNMAVNLPCLDGGPQGATGFAQQLNPDYSQVQIRFGGLEQVETFSFNYWNPLMTAVDIYGCWPGSLVSYNRTVTFAQAESQYGIKIDILPAQSQWRSQEWFLPWASWGSPNTTALTRRQKGEKIAMCFGYNDLDPGTQTQSSSMRWRNADPYSNTYEEEVAGTVTGVHTSYDAWGDIEFSDGLDAASPPAGWPTAIKASIAHTRTAKGVARSEYFTLDGKSITSTRALPAGAVLLRRVTLDNGKTISARVPLSTVR